MAQYLSMIPTAISAVSAGASLVDKYAPKIRGLANNIFSKRKRHSAMHYIKNLGTAKGFKKLITHDIGDVAGKASKIITSGKVLKGITNVSNDLQNVANMARPLVGNSASKAIGNAQSRLTRFHDVAHQYNEQGKELATHFNRQGNANDAPS